MNKNRKRSGFALLLTTLMLVAAALSGCSGGKSAGDVVSGGESSAGGDKGGTVTITHYTIDSEDRTFVEKLIPDFEAKHPNIKVKVEKAPYEQFDSKLQTLIAGGKSPDVTSHYGYGGFAEYYNKDMLLDLTDIIQEDGFKAGD